MRFAPHLVALILLALPGWQSTAAQQGRTYAVDCGSAQPHSGASPFTATLHSLDEVNALNLQPGDTVQFRRGTVCHGSLHPQGSGNANAPIRLGAYGEGSLPRIEASPKDEAVLRLFNQEGWLVQSLDLRGGTTYGVFISGDRGAMRSITLRNLTITGVRGPLRRKESGLVVIRPSSSSATFADVMLDGIRAYNTTQWAGIFVAGTSLDRPISHVHIKNSIVHDVQGDGIVLFNTSDGEIDNSVAWHTGMQHSQSIGTPNAIWTWQCNACVVANNEAFLTDSPGVDGGAFDIDWGNTANQARDNFGHDTQGYCISVFGANGPTTHSVVSGNLCLANGLSPRLAQRQGAILVMTWQGGSIDDLLISNNRIDWNAPGNVPAIQTGSNLNARNVTITGNEIHTTGTRLLDPALASGSSRNRYFLVDATADDLLNAQRELAEGHEPDTTVALEPAEGPFHFGVVRKSGWQLVANVPGYDRTSNPGALLVRLETAAIQFRQSGLRVSLTGDADTLQSARDWGLADTGVELHARATSSTDPFSIKLISPQGKVAHSWSGNATAIDLGLALRRALGRPIYGRLDFEPVRATD